jgi:outer membrane murein-binding lipoprotein Lpp
LLPGLRRGAIPLQMIRNANLRRLAISIACFCTAAGLLSGCGSKARENDSAKLVAEIEKQIGKLDADYDGLKRAAPHLAPAILGEPTPSAQPAARAMEQVGHAVSASEDSFALIESNLLRLSQGEDVSPDYKKYAGLEKKADKKRKKAWAQIKLWWDDYRPALEAAQSLTQAVGFLTTEFPAEYAKISATLDDEGHPWWGKGAARPQLAWVAGLQLKRLNDERIKKAKDTLVGLSERVQTHREAVSRAAKGFEIKTAAQLSAMLSTGRDLADRSISLCDALLAKDKARTAESLREIEAAVGKLNSTKLEANVISAEIRASLDVKGKALDLAKTDKLLEEAGEFEAKAKAARPKTKSS